MRQSIIDLKEEWDEYHKLKNEIIKEINQAHESYQNNLFDSQTDTHHKKFWRCVKKLRKDYTGLPSLTVNDQVLHNLEEKAEVLNNLFILSLQKKT